MLNNTTPQPVGYGHKLEVLNQKSKNVSLNTDSVALFCLGALSEELNSKAFFKTVKLKKESLNASENFLKPLPLDADSIKNICNRYHADAAVILDKIKIEDLIAEYYIAENNTFAGVLEVQCETEWSIVDAKTEGYARLKYRDTIYWENPSYTIKSAMNNLPKRIDGVIDGALNAGKKIANRLTPYWDKEDRYFFKSGNKYIKAGIDSVYYKNWNGAALLWQHALKSGNATTRAFAAHNIAITKELSGEIDSAISYQQQAVTDYARSAFMTNQYLGIMSDYLNSLQRRKTELELLRKQIGNE